MRLAFRIVAGVFGMFTLGTSVPFAIGSFVDDTRSAHHYGGEAVGSLMIVLFAVAPALGAAGSRVAVWLVGVPMAIIAVGSLAYADHVSALETPWAGLALAWAATYVAVAEASVRRRQPVAVA